MKILKNEEAIFPHTFKALRKQIEEHKAAGRQMWQQRQSTASEFCRALVGNGYLTEEQMQRAAQRYRLGTARDGGVIFWQIDEFDQVRDGKIMHYRPDCHRDHDRKPIWTNYLLRKNDRLLKDWNMQHCLFGLHLLGEEAIGKPDAGKGIAVVEAEKTAVIMSEVKPAYIWMATGGKTELNAAKLHPLKGHRIILFPDTDEDGQTYREWYDIAEAASDVLNQHVTVSSILEQRATHAQKLAKIDLVDMLFT